MTVQRSDLPASYQAKAYQPAADDAANQAALVACIGATDTTKDKTGEAHSPDYSQGNTQISSQAQSFRSAADVAADVALIRSPKAAGCYEKTFTTRLGAALPAGAKVTKVSITINARPTGQPANVVGTGSGTITLQLQGQIVPINVAVAFITGTLIESEVDVLTIASPIPTALEAALVRKVAARTAAG